MNHWSGLNIRTIETGHPCHYQACLAVADTPHFLQLVEISRGSSLPPPVH